MNLTNLELFYTNKDYINKYGVGLVKGAQCYQYEGELTCAPIKTDYKTTVINIFKDYLINMKYAKNINIEPWGMDDCYELEIDIDFFNLKGETKTIKSFFFISFYEKDKTIIKFLKTEDKKEEDLSNYHNYCIAHIAHAWCLFLSDNYKLIS